MRIRQTLLIGLVLCCGFQMALADEIDSHLIVVESTPANLFEKGQILASEKSIKLATGQRVKLIAIDGTVFTLIGKDFGASTRHIDDSKDALEKALLLLGDVNKNIVRSGEKQPTGVWMANIDMDGNYCSLKNKITLWRSDANQTATLLIETDKSNAEPVKINWPAKKETLTFAFRQGTKYWIYFDHTQDNQHGLTFYRIPAHIKKVFQRVRWMAKQGCLQQAIRCFPGGRQCQ